jgi:hypothetical protein
MFHWLELVRYVFCCSSSVGVGIVVGTCTVFFYIFFFKYVLSSIQIPSNIY